MKTGPAQMIQFVFVYRVRMFDGKYFYYDVALPFWNLVDARTYARGRMNEEAISGAKVLEVFPL